MLTCNTRSTAETRALGGSITAVTTVGDVVILSGDLGAGKTAFVQGFAAALGVKSPVTSPTFTLANRYVGTMVINHLDVYRFESLDEVQDLALEELLEDGVTLVEWGETIASVLPAQRLVVRITFGQGDDDRVFEFSAHGNCWDQRAAVLVAALGQ